MIAFIINSLTLNFERLSPVWEISEISSETPEEKAANISSETSEKEVSIWCLFNLIAGDVTEIS